PKAQAARRSLDGSPGPRLRDGGQPRKQLGQSPRPGGKRAAGGLRSVRAHQGQGDDHLALLVLRRVFEQLLWGDWAAHGSMVSANPMSDRRADTPALASRHLLGIEGLQRSEVEAILGLARQYKQSLKEGKQPTPLADKFVALLFFEDSTRTRSSFEIAAKS